MTLKERGFTLKVCRTCRYWSDKQKGVCSRLEQGVGQFWMCEDWTEITPSPANARESGEQEAPGAG
jgi:hypothetical protein